MADPTEDAAQQRKARLDLFVVSAAHAVTHVQAAVMPLIYTRAMPELGFGYALLGSLLGVSNMVGGFLQGAYGWASRYLPRRTLLGGGNVLLGLSMIWMGVTQSVAPFFAGNVLAKVASSPQHPMANSLISDWYGPKRRGMAFSIHVTGGSVGSLVTPFLGTVLIALVGWRWSLALFALTGLFFGTWFALSAKDDRIPAVERARARENRRTSGSAYRRLLRNRALVLMLVASMVAAGGRGVGVVLTYVPMYLKDGLGLSDLLVGTLFTVLAAGSVIGPLVGGWLADHWGQRPVLLLALAIAAVATSFLIVVGSGLAGLYLACTVMGIAVYMVNPVMQSLFADLSDDSNRDDAFSLFFMLTFGAGGIWNWILGYVIDRAGFASAFAVTVASYIAAGLVVLAAGRFAISASDSAGPVQEAR